MWVGRKKLSCRVEVVVGQWWSRCFESEMVALAPLLAEVEEVHQMPRSTVVFGSDVVAEAL